MKCLAETPEKKDKLLERKWRKSIDSAAATATRDGGATPNIELLYYQCGGHWQVACAVCGIWQVGQLQIQLMPIASTSWATSVEATRHQDILSPLILFIVATTTAAGVVLPRGEKTAMTSR